MNQMHFVATRPSEPIPLSMRLDCATAQFACNSQYLEKDHKPWLPVMAEFHYARYDREDWELELRKIKSCGVEILATYVFWIFHEEEEGKFCFEGNRDLSYFLHLCKEVGLYAFVRIGPWCHGECRNGGFPDWLQNSGIPLRGCDERYLRYVRRLYEAYAEQIKPWLIQNGGSVIGIQLENELTENEPYLAELKKIALECGITVPFYTVTGWGRHVTEFPEGEVIPVFGGYPAAPWEHHTDPLPINENYFFSLLRNDADIGSDQITGKRSLGEEMLQNYPFATCELGAGNQVTYHRRPTISTMDGMGITVTKLGSGNVLPGYYMFHGGFNPPEGFYQESKACGYPNDCPVSSYDFQAPLDEYGQARPSYFHLKRFHQFIQCCGERLAPMPSILPDLRPANKEDMKTPRFALRSDGESGFLFFHTHQRNYPMSAIKDLSVSIRFASGEEATYGPLNIPAETCGIFPVRQTWNGVPVEFMTAQPIWFGMHENKATLVCFAPTGVEPTLVLDKACSVCTNGFAQVESAPNAQTVHHIHAGKDSKIDVTVGSASLRIVVLNDQESLQFYPVELSEGTQLVIDEGIVFEQDDRVMRYVETPATSQLQAMCQDVRIEKASDQKISPQNPFATYLFADPAQCPEYALHIPIAMADAAFDATFVFDIHADVVQLYADDLLIADEFLRAEPWKFSLRRVAPYLRAGKQLRLKCSPVTPERKVYLDVPVEAGDVRVELKDMHFYGIDESADSSRF